MWSLASGGNKVVKRKMTVKDAIRALEEAEMDKLLDSDEVHRRAVQACEQDGIVVIDEIDKVVVSSDMAAGLFLRLCIDNPRNRRSPSLKGFSENKI